MASDAIAMSLPSFFLALGVIDPAPIVPAPVDPDDDPAFEGVVETAAVPAAPVFESDADPIGWEPARGPCRAGR